MAERASALSAFHRLATESFTVVGIASSHFRVATGYLDRPELGLRTSDALHLAVAADNGAQMCTLDQRMATAGPILGVPTLPVASIVAS